MGLSISRIIIGKANHTRVTSILNFLPHYPLFLVTNLSPSFLTISSTDYKQLEIKKINNSSTNHEKKTKYVIKHPTHNYYIHLKKEQRIRKKKIIIIKRIVIHPAASKPPTILIVHRSSQGHNYRSSNEA